MTSFIPVQNALRGESDHGATKSLYGEDSNGNEFEVMTLLPQNEWGQHAHQAPVHRISGRPATGFAWQDTMSSEDRTLYDASHNFFEITAGGGVDVFINEIVFVGTEFRSTSPLYKGAYHPTSAGSASGFGDIDSNLEMWNLFFHVGIKFGGPPKGS